MGSHTVTHRPLDTLDQNQMLGELRASREALEEIFPGVRIVSLSYPFSRTNAQVRALAASLYTSGRLGPPPAGDSLHHDPSRADLLELHSLFLCSGESPALWNDAVDRAVQDRGWLIETLHPLDEEGHCQVHAADFASHLAYLSSLAGRIWVAPVAEVVARIAEWRGFEIVIVAQSAREIALQWAGIPPAADDWQVNVNIAQPQTWQVVDRRGRQLSARVQNDLLRFAWPARQSAIWLEKDQRSTFVTSASWGQLKRGDHSGRRVRRSGASGSDPVKGIHRYGGEHHRQEVK